MARKSLEDIGERRVIDVIKGLLTGGKVAVGIGDDCAAIDMGDEYLLITTDMINERTHIPKATAEQIGWHLVAINLSDIASKGGRPIGVVTALGLPRRTGIEFVKGLARGMDRCATTFDTFIIGGDTKESGELNLTGTAFGLVKKDAFMPRSGARPGDMVAVTGRLGGAAAGFQAINSGLKRPAAQKALLEPWPRVREGIALGYTHIITSCIDISDGLSTSLHHLAKASKMGFSISRDLLPVHEEVYKVGFADEKAVEEAVLHFGGEYELLMTIDPGLGSLAKASAAVNSQGTELTVIGVVTEKGVVMKRGNKLMDLEDRGWEHFRPRKKSKT
jgi:thiamine-monophosphate kinase